MIKTFCPTLEQLEMAEATRYMNAVNKRAWDVTDLISLEDALEEIRKAHTRTGKPIRRETGL